MSDEKEKFYKGYKAYENDCHHIAKLSEAMKAKMLSTQDKGRGGWEDPDQVTDQELSDQLRRHVLKGDPVDVANYCMMLFARGGSILPEKNKEF